MNRLNDRARAATKNGPLAPLARTRQQLRASLERIIEDRDAMADVSVLPELSDFPVECWQFFGVEPAVADHVTSDDEVDDEITFELDELSADEIEECKEISGEHRRDHFEPGELDTFRKQDGLQWVRETYGSFDYVRPVPIPDATSLAHDWETFLEHMRDNTLSSYDVYGTDFSEHSLEPEARPNDEHQSAPERADDYDPGEEVDAMIAKQDEEMERFLETLPIDHVGGCRGVRATLAASKNLTRPHHFIDLM